MMEKVEQTLPPVANLIECQLAQVREHEQREVDEDRDRREQDRRADCNRAADTPAAFVGGADHRTECRARGHRRERGRADDEKTNGRGCDRARDDGAHAMTRADDRERDHGGNEQHAAERDDLTDNRQRKRQIGQYHRLCEFGRAQSPSACRSLHPARIADRHLSNCFAPGRPGVRRSPARAGGTQSRAI